MKNIKFIWLIILIVVLVFAVWKINTSNTTLDNIHLSQLQDSLKTVTPHFVNMEGANAQLLTTEEQKIKDDMITFLASESSEDNRNYYSRLRLNAIGKRYILVTQPSAGSSYDRIIDSETGTITDIAGESRYYLNQEGRNVVIYIDSQAIYLYELDQAGVQLISGSQLYGTETYNSGESDFAATSEQTHTTNSITISVFDYSQLMQNPDARPNGMQTMNKRLRTVTLPF